MRNFVLMATTQQLYDTTQFLINKYDGSFMDNTEFLQAYNLASYDYFRYLTDMAYAMMTRTGVYSTPTNSDNQVAEALSPFAVYEASLTTPFSKPSDYGRTVYLKIGYDTTTQVNAKFAYRVELTELDNKINNPIDVPIAEEPIYTEINGKFLIYPLDPSGVWLTYYKKPVKQTAVDSTTVEWNDTQVNNILFRILSYLGINLKDANLIQFGNLKKSDS